MKTLKKVLAVGGVIAAFCLLLILLYIAEENIRGRISRSQAERSLRAQNEPMTLADLHLPIPGVGKNSGPLVVAASKELHDLSKTNPLVCQGLHGLMHIDESGQARVRFLEAVFPESKMLLPPRKGDPPLSHDWAEAESELAHAEAPLSRLREALKQPVVMPVVDYQKDLAARTELEPWQAGGWLLSCAETALHAGNLNAAVENIVSALALADYMRREYRMLAQLGAFTTDGSAQAVIWEALQAQNWTEEQLASVQAALYRQRALRDAIESLEFERVMIPSRLTMLREHADARQVLFRLDGRNIMEDIMGDNEPSYPSETAVWLRSSLWWAAWSYQDEARALEAGRVLLLHAKKLRDARSWTAFNQAYPKVRHPLQGLARWQNAFSQMADPQTSRDFLGKIVCVEVQRQMTIVAVAIKRYTLRTGSVPASLKILVPEFLPEIPVDPMDDNPLRYRPGTGTRFTLYSVGTDGQDNGGDFTIAKDEKRRDLWSRRDAVWPMAIEK